MRTFHTMIATLDKALYDGEAVHCRIRTESGAIGLEARHEPFLAAIEPGSTIELRLEDGQAMEFPVSDGMLTFQENHCTILVAPRT